MSDGFHPSTLTVKIKASSTQEYLDLQRVLWSSLGLRENTRKIWEKENTLDNFYKETKCVFECHRHSDLWPAVVWHRRESAWKDWTVPVNHLSTLAWVSETLESFLGLMLTGRLEAGAKQSWYPKSMAQAVQGGTGGLSPPIQKVTRTLVSSQGRYPPKAVSGKRITYMLVWDLDSPDPHFPKSSQVRNLPKSLSGSGETHRPQDKANTNPHCHNTGHEGPLLEKNWKNFWVWTPESRKQTHKNWEFFFKACLKCAKNSRTRISEKLFHQF